MKKGQHKAGAIIEDKNNGQKFLDYFAPELSAYIQSNHEEYCIYHKNIEHSDLPTYGKGTKNHNLIDHLLYYYTEDEMKKMKNISFAKQSNIGVDAKFFDLMGIDRPRKNSYSFKDKGITVYVNNKSLKYFSTKYTELVFNNLNKEFSGTRRKNFWDFNQLSFDMSDGMFTEIDLHVAKLGVGTEEDVKFDVLRHHIFVGDHIIFVYLKNSKKLLISLAKNPRFFTVIKQINELYEYYLRESQKHLITATKSNKLSYEGTCFSDEELRQKYQKIWRDLLVDEVRSLPNYSDRVFCTFTGIGGEYPQLSPLFRASHIKGLKDEHTEYYEKYDIDNGLLLCANADALFDKHLITIDQNKNIVFSFFLDNNTELKRDLKLLNPVMECLLNEKRMEYLRYHREKFEQLEKKRSKPGYDFSFEED